LEKFGFWVFVGECHNGGKFMHFGQGHRALGTTAITLFFDLKFYWKLGYDSGHSPWSAF